MLTPEVQPKYIFFIKQSIFKNYNNMFLIENSNSMVECPVYKLRE